VWIKHEPSHQCDVRGFIDRLRSRQSVFLKQRLVDVDEFDEMPHFSDHAPGCRCIQHVGDATDPIESEPDQGKTLVVGSP